MITFIIQASRLVEDLNLDKLQELDDETNHEKRHVPVEIVTHYDTNYNHDLSEINNSSNVVDDTKTNENLSEITVSGSLWNINDFTDAESQLSNTPIRASNEVRANIYVVLWHNIYRVAIICVMPCAISASMFIYILICNMIHICVGCG
jgi:hypothetical protein